MRNLQLEAELWYLFTSQQFYEAAACECEATMEWFGNLAVARGVMDFGRNRQIYDTFSNLASNLRRDARLAALGDYELIVSTAGGLGGDIRGILDQPLHSWMTGDEYEEFFDVRIGRVTKYTSNIPRALHNGLYSASSFCFPNKNYPEQRDIDGSYPGDAIRSVHSSAMERYNDTPLPGWTLPDPLPEYVIDKSVTCRTGDDVPWTGVWYPGTGLERHSLAFAIAGQGMQPAYHVIKTSEERKTDEWVSPPPQTVAVATHWHPVVHPDRPLVIDRKRYPAAQHQHQTKDPAAKHGQSGFWLANLWRAITRSG